MKGNRSPTILTCMGAIGTVATAIFTAQATPKALNLLEEAKEEKGEELTTLEKVQIAAPLYIPAALTCTATLACIFGANVLNKRQQASLISAYAMLENSYSKYRHKTKEVVGEEKEKEIHMSIHDNDDDEPYLLYDMSTDRYFETSLEPFSTDDGLEGYIINSN